MAIPCKKYFIKHNEYVYTFVSMSLGINVINGRSSPSIYAMSKREDMLPTVKGDELKGLDLNDSAVCQMLLDSLPVKELTKNKRIQLLTDHRYYNRLERNNRLTELNKYLGSGLLFAVLFPRILKEVNKSSGVFGQLGYNQQMTLICAWIHSKINYNCFMYENIALFDIVEGHRLIHLSLRQLRDMGYIAELDGIEVHKLTGKHIKPGNNRKYYKMTRQGEQIFKDVLKAVLKSFEKATKQFFDIPLLEKLGKEE